MGEHTSFTILITFFILSAFVSRKSNGFETCPDQIRSVCECFYPFFTVRCSHKELKEHPDFSNIQGAMQKLDVSFNQLWNFPTYLHEFHSLEILDFSHNQIDLISSTILLPNKLRSLSLSYNNISDWFEISSNTIFESGLNLETLDLTGNPLGAYNGNDDRFRLINKSLKTLDLSDCQINKIIGSRMLIGLVNLKHLILRSNPLLTLPELFASKLLSIDLRACNLTTLRPTVFSQMPILTSLNLSENYHLSLVNRNEAFVESVSLREIDLSKCNLNAVEIKGFPNITTVNLNGNLITELNDNSFQNNILIENLDLSSNSIKRISLMAFQWLRKLRTIDLSLNMIRQIDINTFTFNQRLTSVNLSRNFIDRFRKFVSISLTYLNMSRCEITRIDADALNDLHELIELDLSYNWFSELPENLSSPSLQILDLSKCRLSHIENNTFEMFPELSRLNLAGNRLTTTFRTIFFGHNEFLNDIWLGDNPWRCKCDRNSLNFYQYLTERPARLKDPAQFRCYSPGNTDGVHWDAACVHEWDTNLRKASLVEKIWTITLAVLVVIVILYSVIYGWRWWSQYRKEIREEQQQQENLETTRELMRHNQIVLEQQSQLNAPDPRESNPPCYDDAIQMPRLDTSFLSLKRESFASNDSVNFIRRAVKRSRCRSEEVLSPGGSRRQIFFVKSRKDTSRQWEKGQSSSSMTALVNNNSALANESSQKSFEIIKQMVTEDGQSPYAKRKLQVNFTAPTEFESSFEEIHRQNFVGVKREMPSNQN